jgi:anti-sigma regulatory factor (Ser/Thr protein kinase)
MAGTPLEDPSPTVSEEAVPLERKFDRSSLAALRTELSRYAAAHGLTDLALANIVLAVNEITTNAVRYAGGQGQLRLWCDGDELYCRVVDDGRGIPPRYLEQVRRPDPAHISGHGLWLARRICAGLEIETSRASGTRVLLRYALPSAARSTDGSV